MSRMAAILAAALLWAVPAAAQTAAPSVHPGTKLSFGSVVGGAKLENSSHTAAVPGVSSGGDTYVYSVGKMQITVDVFDAGRHVPPGSGNPTVSNQFETEANAAEQQIRTAGYQRFERPTVPSTCSYGATAFRCLVYSAQTGGTRLYSKLLLTGYNGYFVKIAIIWSIADRHTLNDADQALNNFIPALMH
jgi:hypothetical protein